MPVKRMKKENSKPKYKRLTECINGVLRLYNADNIEYSMQYMFDLLLLRLSDFEDIMDRLNLTCITDLYKYAEIGLKEKIHD